ncbi:MAG TPA: tripartite tricarboxylate transporter substrate binding protein [Beijerinckiaceae bacterium]|jgi:tripartite-type tricarboxylate transporter receptor subunit TctC
MKRPILALALATLAALGASPARAQQPSAWPDRPIRVIVPFAAGGAVDALARVVGAKLQESLKQPVIVENRPGAGGNIATDAVAKAAPDGYTMLLTTNGHAISPSLYKSLPFDPIGDFAPVTQVISSSLLLVANPKLPAKTLPELLALARQKPGALNYGSTGVGNPLHLTMEMLKREAKVDILMVPFRGDAPLNQALVQGDVEMAVVPLSTARPQVEAGTLRAIAVTGEKRSPAMPDVPTVAEQGVPGFASSSWQGLFYPAKTPREIVVRVQQEVAKAMQDPDVLKRLSAFGVDPVASTPDAFAAKVKSDVAAFAKIVEQAKIPKLE